MKRRDLLQCLLVLSIALLALAPSPSRATSAVSGTWKATGSLHQALAFATATLLPSGQVLVAGGCKLPCGDDSEASLATAELYNPSTGTWAATGSMHRPRLQYILTVLRNGEVLATGGCATTGCTTVLAGAELYDPHTGTWTRTGSLHRRRTLQTATLLLDGRVLVAGGVTGCNAGCTTVLASAEIYNPSTGKWTKTGSMHQARARHTATLLPDGRVLVAGGTPNGANNAGTLPSGGAELYDPRTGTWTRTGSLHNPRLAHTAILLSGGLVLAAGGDDANGYVLQAEIYHPRTGTWTATGSLHQGRDYQTGEAATLLHNGQVLVAGNTSNHPASAERYSPHAGTWAMTGSMLQARGAATATLLPDDRVLVAGGGNNTRLLSSAELYHP